MKGKTSRLTQVDHKSVTILHRLLKKVNMTMFGAQCFNNIKKLENSVIRGEGKSHNALQSRSSAKKKANSLSKYMKSQHPVTENGKYIIVSLPKQEFGRHETYAAEENFYSSHFIEEKKRMSPNRRKEVHGLMRQFNLANKKQESASNRPSQRSYQFSAGTDQEVFAMKAGRLICRRNKHIIRIYDDDLDKFRSASRDLKKRSKSYEPVDTRQSEVVGRLHPKNNFVGGEMCQKLTSKYSSLFSTFDTRPYTANNTIIY